MKVMTRAPLRAGAALATGALLLAGCADDATGDDVLAGPAPTASATASATASPSPSASGTAIPVVTSTDFYGDIVSRIGGDRVAVTPIITDAGQDPHSFEATARTQLAVADARLIVENGGHYDDFMSRLRAAAGGERPVINAVEAAGLDAGEAHSDEEGEAHSDEEGAANEHVWYDMEAMDALAGRIADELSLIEPSSEAQFDANVASFRDGLAMLTARQAEIKTAHEGAAIAITEPVPLFLLEDCGLVNRTPAEFSEAIEEGFDVPVRVLADTLALMSGGQVEALVYNDQTTGPQTEQLREAAEANGVPVVAVTETLPDGVDYLTWMAQNLDAVRDALV